MCVYDDLCKNMSKKMNLNVCQRVREPERKCEYDHKYGYKFMSLNESSIMNMS